MASGDLTLTNLGTCNISGALLKTTVDAVTGFKKCGMSGAGIYFVPSGDGQVQVLKLEVA